MSKEDMVKEAVEEARAKAAREAAETGDEAEAEAPGDSEEAEENTDAEENADEVEEAVENEEIEEQDTKSGKGLFGKKKKKDKKDEKIEELTDRITRQMAEFDNFRKRTDKEKSQMYEVGAKDVIEKILSVIDDFERGFGTVEEADKNDAFVQGMEMVYKKLMTTLEGIGVKPIEAVGQEFNPDFHNAVLHVEDESLGANIVAEELQKGYMYRDTVVRYSMVKVAN
ncbi:nucleotide exchange factor GrpE [Mediterraneibacter agrestimuris]|uniref:nucleotide exchange factor GrpE n=1 Tax=Mediterraneibacter agrestimuris TaxID=2941333 RepID=UPI002040552C|nr:nucleotide exchange factor GrpE [Mediterraneibacter agrestimuris]